MDKFQISSSIQSIDSKNIKEVENLIRNSVDKDFILEIYDNALLISERLRFILENCSKCVKISVTLIKKLLKDNNIELLDIVFNSIKFFNTDFILNLLNHYKNKISISTSKLNQQIEKYKISTKKDKHIWCNYYNSSNIYVVNACENGKDNLLKWVYEQLKIDIRNLCGKNGETLLFIACQNGNLKLVKFLVELGENINKSNRYGETPFFHACKSGNVELVEYLIKLGVDINKKK